MSTCAKTGNCTKLGIHQQPSVLICSPSCDRSFALVHTRHLSPQALHKHFRSVKKGQQMTSESLDLVEKAGNLSASLAPVQPLLKMYHARRGKNSIDDVVSLIRAVSPMPIKAMLKFYDTAVQNCINEFSVAFLGIEPVWDAAFDKALELIRSSPSDRQPTTVSIHELTSAGVSIQEATTLQHNANNCLFMTAISQKAPESSTAKADQAACGV